MKYPSMLSLKKLICCLIILAGCNSGQDVKDALETQKKQDSLLAEFKKVNEQLKKSETHIDSVKQWLDSIDKSMDTSTSH